METLRCLLLPIRFVDRDMSMRYRGGGIGHKYMREVEAKYENMSRERLHGKQPHHKPGPSQMNNADVGSTSDSDDGPEDPVRLQGNKPAAGSLGSDRGGDGEDGEDSEDSEDSEDYVPSEISSSSDEAADSDEIVSDFNYDSYGLADP